MSANIFIDHDSSESINIKLIKNIILSHGVQGAIVPVYCSPSRRIRRQNLNVETAACALPNASAEVEIRL
jgi:hypothetical protein